MHKLIAVSLGMIAVFVFAGGANSSNSDERDKVTNKAEARGDITELSVDAITIELRNAQPHYRLPDINRSFTEHDLAKFLNQYYRSIDGNKNKPDIILGPTPKMQFHPIVINTVRAIRQRCDITVVQMPPMTNRDSHAPFRAFADITLGKRNITKP